MARKHAARDFKSGRVVALAGALVLCLAHGARAQESTDRNDGVARQLFQEGVEAAKAHQWKEARERFERSYLLAPRLLTLFNLAGAQRNTGQLMAATESYRRFLQQSSDGRYTRFRVAARRLLELLGERIPYAQIRASGVGPRDQLRLDGALLGTGALHEPIPVDPGTHSVLWTRGTRVIGSRSFTVHEGQTREVALQVSLSPNRHLSMQDGEEDQNKKGGVVSSPLFWTAVGVAAAGIAATSYYFVTRNDKGYGGSFGVINVP